MVDARPSRHHLVNGMIAELAHEPDSFCEPSRKMETMSRATTTLSLANHVLITLFGVSSGLYKVTGGEADLRVFSALGMSAMSIAIFGAVQALAAAGTWPTGLRRVAAWILAACNLLASIGLFAAGTTTFGFVSLLFVASAVWVTKRSSSTVSTP